MKSLFFAAFFALVTLAFAQSFTSQAVQAVSAGTFRNGSAGYIRAYKAQDINGHILISAGFRAVGGIANNTAGLAADLLLFVMSTNFDTAVAAAYFDVEGRASWTTNGNATVSWSAAGVAAGLRFYKIIEYEETNGVSGFQPGGDTILSHYNLIGGPWRWENFQYEHIPAPNDPSVVLSRVTARTTDGVFAFRVSGSGNYTSSGRYKLDPSTLKIDVMINYYSAQNTPSLFSSGPSNAALHPNASICLVVGLAGIAGASSGAWNGNVSNPTATADNAGLVQTRTVGAQVGKWGVFFTHDQYVNWSSSAVGGAWYSAGVAAAESDTDPTAQATGQDAGFLATAGTYAGWKAVGGKMLKFYSFTGAYRPPLIEWDPAIQVTGINDGTPDTQAPSNAPSPPNSSASVVALSFFALIAALLLML